MYRFSFYITKFQYYKNTFQNININFFKNMQIQDIQPDTKMYEILNFFPSAQRVLFQKFHIGGCSNCGYSLNDTIKEVFIKHNKIHLLDDAINALYESLKMDQMFQISPQDLKELLEHDPSWKLIDVREPFEQEIAVLPDSLLLTRELAFEILEKWDKNTPMIFYCHTGIRSLEATYYFYNHGFRNVKNLKGGIDAYAKEVDPSIPLY